ncbi:MAG TPA: 5-methyltetrahydropteroyltriglutamate--homocysteine S-methyltransferase [Actinomycetes bacterium]|nr:5-methyltetrahydropteroyltriglutamate--homocysteine S-methyltransferase [Actinomycetes bacterium]
MTDTRATVLGYPRMGPDRELKKVTEAYWAGTVTASELRASAAALRRNAWQALTEAGLDEVPVNDFSLYDHMLDAAVLLGAIPPRHEAAVPPGTADRDLELYFAMARGTDRVTPLEMTKWFDTNYHFLVPELAPDTEFALRPAKPLAELGEARDLGLAARPVLIGPVTFLALAKPAEDAPMGFDPMTLLDRVVDLYAQLLPLLSDGGAEWVQFDEPILVTDVPSSTMAAAEHAYARLCGLSDRPNLLVATYFDVLGDALDVLRRTPIDGLALDFTGPAAGNLDLLARAGGLPGRRLIAGVVDGRNVWLNDLEQSLSTLGTLLGLAGEVVVAPSCSLLHVPLHVEKEDRLDPQVRRWLAFAEQKLAETVVLGRGMTGGAQKIAGELTENKAVRHARATSPITTDRAVRDRAAAVTEIDLRRAHPYSVRAKVQHDALRLPTLPTTTIGSFPQTSLLRAMRARLLRGELDRAEYEVAMRVEIERVIRLQEELGLDVLVHGEPERNDMVQYFAEQLTGYLATSHGWVQSYGTRYVRPPIIVGDVSRPAPMTVEWIQYASSLTDRPVKGMLTGPVTMLAWSFVRDDLPRADVARQVALALRDEVADLHAAGIEVIQVDEPALRETLPLRTAARPSYLTWAADAFRLATGNAPDEVQVHTHMCYAEFGEILSAVADLDADVISLEAARSRMQIATELADAGYPAEVGPGVYDIHSPRVPGVDEIATRLRLALAELPADRVWVNPDCGLKTRQESEAVPALRNLVAAAEQVRAELAMEPGVAM